MNAQCEAAMYCMSFGGGRDYSSRSSRGNDYMWLATNLVHTHQGSARPRACSFPTSAPRAQRQIIPSPCAKVCNAASYHNAQCSQRLDRVHRDTVFFDTLFGSISDLDITVPFYSEHCVLHPHRRGA